MTAVASFTDSAIQARGRGALRAQQVRAVDDVQREDRRLRGHGRHAEREQRAQRRGAPLRASPDLAAQRPPQAEQDDRRADVVAGEVAARALVGEDDERHRQDDRQHDVRQRRDEVRPPALVDAQDGVGDLEVRERPQPEDPDAHDPRVLEAEQQLAERAGDGDRRRATATVVASSTAWRRRRREAVALGARLARAVEAHERLPEPEAQQDRREDDERQQRLGDPEVRPRQRVRVERQRDEREHGRDDARRLVGDAARQQASEEAAHRWAHATVRACRSPSIARAPALRAPRRERA